MEIQINWEIQTSIQINLRLTMSHKRSTDWHIASIELIEKNEPETMTLQTVILDSLEVLPMI